MQLCTASHHWVWLFQEKELWTSVAVLEGLLKHLPVISIKPDIMHLY